MKRIYVCIGIVVLLLAAAFYSSFRVQQFAEDISDDIDTAMEDIRNSDLTGARQALAEGAELCDTMREGMNHLLRTQDFTELEAAARRRWPSGTECTRGSLRGTAPGAGSGRDPGLALPPYSLRVFVLS